MDPHPTDDRTGHQLPTIAWIRAAIAPALVFISTSMARGYQTDLWSHLARGRIIATTGHRLAFDTLTCTVRGEKLLDASGWMQWAFYALFMRGGLDLVQLINSLLLTMMAALLVWECWRVSRRMGAAAIASLLAVIGMSPLLLIRPQTASLVLFIVLCLLLDSARQPRRRWLLLLAPPMLALWANLHGAFPIGCVLIGCYAATDWGRWAAKRRRKPPVRGNADPVPPMSSPAEGCGEVHSAGGDTGGTGVIPRTIVATANAHRVYKGVAANPEFSPAPFAFSACLLFSAVATCLNPYGWTIYSYIAQVSQRVAGRGIEEWLAPAIGTYCGNAWLASMAILAGLFLVRRRKPSMRESILIACFLAPTFHSSRMLVWWFLIAAPIAAHLIAELLAQRDGGIAKPAPGPSWLAAGALAVMLAAATLSIPQLARFNPIFGSLRSNQRPESELQAQAEKIETLSAESGADSPRHRVFSRLEWADYLDWALPKSEVFMDARIEIYPDPLWERYCAINAASTGWQQTLDDYNVDVLLLDASYQPRLLLQVQQSPRWKQESKQGDSWLFVRQRNSSVSRVAINSEF